MTAEAPAAQTKLGLYAGYGRSQFDNCFPLGLKEHQATGYVPMGVLVLWHVLPRFLIGLELNHSVIPFTWEQRVGDQKQADEKVTQTILGAVARYEFGIRPVSPHVVGGIGLHMDRWIVEYVDDVGFADQTYDFKRAMGLHIGGGISAAVDPFRYLFAELLYHHVNKRLDSDHAKEFSYDNWALRFGIIGPIR